MGLARPSSDALAKMRSIGTSSAIGAALLLYFGYVTLAEPGAAELFERAALLLYHTLRIGGVVSAVIAILLWAGLVPALVLDAVAGILIGACLIFSGGGMAIGGGGLLQPAICVLGGGLFIRAGVYSGRVWREILPRAAEQNGVQPGIGADSSAVKHVEKPAPADQPLNQAADGSLHAMPPADEPRTQGYLASFARKRSGEDGS